MVARYKPWAVLIILSSVNLCCLVFQIILLIKKNVYPVPMNIYIFKVLWTGFHILHWICNSYGAQIYPIVGAGLRQGQKKSTPDLVFKVTTYDQHFLAKKIRARPTSRFGTKTPHFPPKPQKTVKKSFQIELSLDNLNYCGCFAFTGPTAGMKQLKYNQTYKK